MAEVAETPSPTIPPVETQVSAVPAPSVASSQPVPKPGDELRVIQMLLVEGIFPGKVAPSVVKSFNFLEQMITVVEKAAEDAKSKNQA